MISKRMQGVIMVTVGSALFLAVVGYAFFKVLFALAGLFLISYGLHLLNKPSMVEYAQRFFNKLKS